MVPGEDWIRTGARLLHTMSFALISSLNSQFAQNLVVI